MRNSTSGTILEGLVSVLWVANFGLQKGFVTGQAACFLFVRSVSVAIKLMIFSVQVFYLCCVSLEQDMTTFTLSDTISDASVSFSTYCPIHILCNKTYYMNVVIERRSPR